MLTIHREYREIDANVYLSNNIENELPTALTFNTGNAYVNVVLD